MNNKILRKSFFYFKEIALPCLNGIEAQKAIVKDLSSNSPSMIARFGAVEIKGLLYATLPPQLSFVYVAIPTKTWDATQVFFLSKKKPCIGLD